MDGDGAFEGSGSELVDRALAGDAGIVHEDVDPTGLGHRELDHPDHVALDGHIGDHGEEPAIGQRLQPAVIDVGRDHGGTVVAVATSEGQAEAAGRAGDDDGASLERSATHGRSSLP